MAADTSYTRPNALGGEREAHDSEGLRRHPVNPWQRAPAQRIAALVAQQQDADLVTVVQALLGAAALSEVGATPLEPGVGHVGEEGGEGAVALLVATHEPVLQLGLDAVALVEHAMDARVVKVCRSDTEQLRQRRARKPALRVERGARCDAALDRERADHLGGPHRHVSLGDDWEVRECVRGRAPPQPPTEAARRKAGAWRAPGPPSYLKFWTAQTPPDPS